MGQQIRQLRQARGFTLAELARRAGTSAPTVHRYENGWDRFEVRTLQRIAAALGARLEVQLVPARDPQLDSTSPSTKSLVKKLAPLFWDRDLQVADLNRHPGWVLERVLTTGDQDHVRAARSFFGDEEMRRAVRRRGVDARTRRYWDLILGGTPRASQGPRT